MTTEDYEDDDIELDEETGRQYRSAFIVAERLWRAEYADGNRWNDPKSTHAELVAQTMKELRVKPHIRLVAMAVRDVQSNRQPSW